MRIAIAVVIALAGCQDAGAATPDKLTAVIASRLVFNGVTTSADGRVFVPFQRQDPTTGLELGEIVDGAPRPYPNASWNAWTPGMPAAAMFVAVNAIRIGPDGLLWVVDKGAVRQGAVIEISGPKLVAIDLATNTVRKIYPLAAVAPGASFVDDVRFNGRHAYLTDAGNPAGLIVLDLDTGVARRVLNDHPSTRQQRVLMAEHRPLIDDRGKPVITQADQLEVSPDGRWFYYQPCTGPMSRIETRFLDDARLTDAELATHVEKFADTGSTGGTAIDGDGNIYASDTDASAILKITPAGKISTLIKDARLVWPDALWIDDHGTLWIPAAQLNRTAGMNHGKDRVSFPTSIYTYELGAKPVRR